MEDGVWIVTEWEPYEPVITIGYFRTEEEARAASEHITAVVGQTERRFDYLFEQYDNLDTWIGLCK